jgi:predicted metalloprotease
MPPARPRAALLAVTALLLTALLGGCGVGVETGGGGGDSTSDPIDEVNADSLAGDERLAVGATDAFWRQQFPETFGRSYRSPEVKGGYRGENGPTCGGQRSVAFNAFYCPSGDFLAWDENLMAAGYRQIGDAWVYLIIAHEWGHAIQARVQRDQVSVAAELQADCLAGATLFGAADRGLVQLEPGDTEELSQTLAAVADDFPWTEESDHGDARERTNSFSRGAQDGVEACLPS